MTPARAVGVEALISAGDRWWRTCGRGLTVCRWLRVAGFTDEDLLGEVRVALLEADRTSRRYDPARASLEAYVAILGRAKLLKLGRRRTEVAACSETEPEPVTWRSARRGPGDERLHPALVRIWRWMDDQDRVVGAAEIPGELRRLGRRNTLESALEDLEAAGAIERVGTGWRTSYPSRVGTAEGCG